MSNLRMSKDLFDEISKFHRNISKQIPKEASLNVRLNILKRFKTLTRKLNRKMFQLRRRLLFVEYSYTDITVVAEIVEEGRIGFYLGKYLVDV